MSSRLLVKYLESFLSELEKEIDRIKVDLVLYGDDDERFLASFINFPCCQN